MSDGEGLSSDLSRVAPITPVLEFQHLSKTFSGQKALSDVSLKVASGEVHGLLGHNGSGKSTLIKVLAGFHQADAGSELFVGGRRIHLPLAPGEFLQMGISFVHQDLGLVPSMTVSDNLNVYDVATRNDLILKNKNLQLTARKLLEGYGLKINPLTKVSELSQTERALLAIARAVHQQRNVRLNRETGLLVLDEPTAFLPLEGKRQLFELIRAVVKDGTSVLFVSHDLDEVMEITDRVTVLRDGVVTLRASTQDLTKVDLVEAIAGRRLETAVIHPSDNSRPDTALTVSGLSGVTLKDTRFDVHRGEVLGITGLMGSGFDEVPYLLFGAGESRGGEISLNGETLSLATMSPSVAMKHGLALLPADRQVLSGVATLSIVDNATVLTLPKYRRGIGLSRKRMVADVVRLGERLDLRPNAPERLLGLLSGGNQQKVLVGKWLQTDPTVLIVHEPTQGVDVGARQQVYELIDEATKRGVSVLCASADLEQLAQICDRVLVFTRGQITGEAKGSSLNKDHLLSLCYGMDAQSI
ncbi:sugar ABC transporter ATP-binding protein [Alicyclobacillus sp. ALC3]|uniref:sugar ABC transporter ATP-binding protein n=1 Tax=Alicyclobacillus sp. ALC3 TaxID=2796143 RepID=UPI0023795843|nr:sugar ABC transporter ATP-binding protein [Alicyclobacillus sp. ALC3]WDL97701.1 sugar ABC transporter ATP-binding protein [Alicyclobacillus sp. ALC3]